MSEKYNPDRGEYREKLPEEELVLQDPIVDIRLAQIEAWKEKFIRELRPEGSVRREGFQREKLSGEFADVPQPFSFKIGKGKEASVTIDAIHAGQEYPKNIVPRMRGEFSFNFENPEKTDIKGDEFTDKIVEKVAQDTDCNALIVETNRLAVDFNRYPKEGSPFRAKDAYNFNAPECSRKKAEQFILEYRKKIKELVEASKSKRHLHLAIHGMVDRELSDGKPLDVIIGTLGGRLCDYDIEAWLYASLKEKLSTLLGREANIGLTSINRAEKLGKPREYSLLEKELKERYGVRYKDLEGKTDRDHLPLRFIGSLPQIVHRLAYPQVNTAQLEISASLRRQFSDEIVQVLSDITKEFGERFGYQERRPEIKETKPELLEISDAPLASQTKLERELKDEMLIPLLREAKIRSLSRRMIGLSEDIREQYGLKKGQRVIVQIKGTRIETDSIVFKGTAGKIRLPEVLRKQLELEEVVLGKKCDIEMSKVRWVPKIILDLKKEGPLEISQGSLESMKELRERLEDREKTRQARSLAKRRIGLPEEIRDKWNIASQEWIIVENRITGKEAIATIYEGEEKCVQIADTLRKELGLEDKIIGSTLKIGLLEKDGEKRIVIEKKET